MEKILKNNLSTFTPPPDDNPYDYSMNNDMHSLTNAIFDPDTGKIMTYRKLIKKKETKATWERSFSNELCCLADSVGDRIPTGTKNIFFIPHSKMLSNRNVSYGKIVCKYKPHKYEKHRSRLMVGGNKVDYPPQRQISLHLNT